MKLYWSPRTRAFRAAWMLEELGRPYERIVIDLRDPEAKADPEFRAASPMGKVPALVDGATRLWDSGAICIYLADAYPDAGLGVPIGDPQRGAFLQWTMFTNSVIEPAIGEKASGQEPDRLRHGFGSFEQMVDTLAAGLGDGPWILGARFTAADVLLGTSAIFLEMLDLMPEAPALRSYLERCRGRDAYRRARAFDEG